MVQHQVTVQVLSAREGQLSQTLAELRDFVTRLGRQAKLAPRAIYNLKLAVDEIATNIVMYAYEDHDPDDTLLTATAHLYEDRLVITLEDNGLAYDPRKRNMPENFNDPLDTRELGGLGVYFALNSVDEFAYEYRQGCNRNTFIMYRPLAGSASDTTYELLLWGPDEAPPAALHQRLRGSGFHVEFISDRPRLITALNQHAYDLLILDATHAHDQALRLLKRLRVMSGQPDMPILVIGNDSKVIVRCMELGATDFLLAPYDDALLVLRVRSAVRQSIPALRHQIRNISKHIKSLLLSDEPALRFGRHMDIDAYLEHTLKELQAIYRADGGKVYLRTTNDALRVAVMRLNSLDITQGGASEHPISLPIIPMVDATTGAPNHYHPASHVAITGETINVPDIYESDAFDYSDERWFDKHNLYRSVSLLTIPLLDHNDTVIGVIQLLNAQDDTGQVIPFDPAQQMLVEALCTHCALVLSTYQLLQKQRRLVSIENDIKIGRRIQRDFMPEETPSIAGWQIAARFYPAREVAGDFYDIFTQDGFLVVMLADVADKGVGAALFMALFRSLLRAFIGQARQYLLALPVAEQTGEALSAQLRKAVQDTNDYILQHHYNLNMFATLFVGIISIRTGAMFHINAGHTPAPFLLRDENGAIIRLPPTAPAVGMFEDARFDVVESIIQPGDVLFAYTDGVTDVRNHHGMLLSERALQHLVRAGANESMDEMMTIITDRIFNQMGSEAQYDDMTLWSILRERHPIAPIT